VTHPTALIRADARSLPLADQSVDLVVTSPPYWALRSYTDGGEHYDGQIGSEPSPAAYVDSLIECTREWMRVLKPSGSIWVNLGDKYAERGGPEREGGVDGGVVNYRAARPRRRGISDTGIRAKSLIGLPWRYAIRCIDDLGLILRAEVIWSKPNGLPESVTDRVRRSHEHWFHLVKSPRYFSAVDTIREPQSENTHARRKDGGLPPKNGAGLAAGVRNGYFGETTFNPLGKLPGSVWEIATEPLTVPDHLGVDHFAAFPMEWPRRIIAGWSPSGICSACGEGRRPVVSAPTTGHDNNPARQTRNEFALKGSRYYAHAAEHPRSITGEACACPDASAPTRPSVILDPFGGTGTTALIAEALGRRGISVDMSADYCRIAAWRTTDPGQRAKAFGVTKPPAETDGQLDLLALTTGGAA
jgi:DNA modification methylase